MTNIPKKLHYCWFGESPLTDLSKRCLETWQQVMPDYELCRWDESALSSASPYVAAAKREKKFAFVADYMRLLCLYREGGIYLDTDTEVLKRFDDLLDRRCFLGMQDAGSIGVGVIGAVPEHPLLKMVMSYLDDQVHGGKVSLEPLPQVVTSIVQSLPPGERPTLLPEEIFFPYNPYSTDPLRRKPLQLNITSGTLSIHHWEGTWLGEMSLRMAASLRVKAVWRQAVAKVYRHDPLSVQSAQRART